MTFFCAKETFHLTFWDDDEVTRSISWFSSLAKLRLGRGWAWGGFFCVRISPNFASRNQDWFFWDLKKSNFPCFSSLHSRFPQFLKITPKVSFYNVSQSCNLKPFFGEKNVYYLKKKLATQAEFMPFFPRKLSNWWWFALNDFLGLVKPASSEIHSISFSGIPFFDSTVHFCRY